MLEGEYKYGGCGQTISVVICNVYSPCSNSEKFEVWCGLEDHLARYQNWACCVMGDFNAVREPSERKGMGAVRVDNIEMDRFNLFIDRCQLSHIPVVRRLFIWYRPNGTSRSRLDKVLVSDNWMMN